MKNAEWRMENARFKGAVHPFAIRSSKTNPQFAIRNPQSNMPRRLSFIRLSVFQQPLLFLSLAFIGGLVFASRYALSLRVWLILAAAIWLMATASLLIERNGKKAMGVLLAGVLAAGGALWALNEASVSEDRIRRLFECGKLKIDEPVEIWGTINAAPELAPDRIYLGIAVERIATLGRESLARGVVLMVVQFNDYESRLEYDSIALEYGTRVRLLGHLSDRRGYLNPGAPDFDALLEYRGYDAAGWVKSPLLIEHLGEGRRNRVLAWLYQIRARAIATILRSFTQPTSGVLAAGLFGNRYFLSREAGEIFRAGGTFHLLVISGLHVAMIAIVVLWLVRRLIISRLVQYTLVLALMWGYAMMVGAQPAITRSVVMLSIVLIGQLIFRASMGPNTLGGSAIVLLVWEPRDIFNPGFQLSFLTVLIIVVLTGPLFARLKQIGEWKPSARRPYPPRVPQLVKFSSEVLFWKEDEFRKEMIESHIRYQLHKARAARWLNEVRLQKALEWIVVTVLTTTAVQVGLLPLMIAQFHRVSLVSPLTNVFEGVLVFALLVAGTIYLTIYSIFGALVGQAAKAVNALGSLVVKASVPVLAWRNASFRVPDFGESSSLVYAAYFIAMLILIIIVNEWNPLRKGDSPNDKARRRIARTTIFLVFLTLALLNFLLIIHPFEHNYERWRLSITFLDVGQGDAMLLSFPRGSLMMLDSGGRPAYQARAESEENEEVFIEDRIGIAEAAVMPYLWHRGIKRLDWIVASHGDADHAEGFAEIAPNFEVGTALKGARSRLNAMPSIFDRAVLASGCPLRTVKRGDAFEIDGARIDVHSPFADADDSSISENNQSLVVKVSFGNRSFLLTGDIEKEVEARLVASGCDLRSDVLKVAHHGSKTSSTAEFLKRVKPQHAVISAANPSPYGHPHPEVLLRLREQGVRIWQTGVCGAITISTDGNDLRIETFIKCEGRENGKKVLGVGF